MRSDEGRRRWLDRCLGTAVAPVSASVVGHWPAWTAAPSGDVYGVERPRNLLGHVDHLLMDPPAHTCPCPGEPVAIMALEPGDRVRLPVMAGDELVGWSEPVTVVSVVLIDTALAEVRWEPEQEEDRWRAHVLLIGPAYHAGARRVC